MEKNEKINLNKPEYFFNRELSWLKFNLRVLREAGVKTTPLLERLKFVAITAARAARSRRKNHAAFGTLEICCHYRV